MNMLPGILVATTLIGGGSLSNLCQTNISELQNRLNSNGNNITTQVINVNPSDLESVLGGLGVDVESIKNILPSSQLNNYCPPYNTGSQTPVVTAPTTGTTKPETTTPATGTTKPETTTPATGTTKPETTTPATGTTKPEATKPSTGTNNSGSTTKSPEVTKPETNNTNSGSKDKAEKSYVEQVVDLVNAERAKVGLSALTMTDKLNGAALVRAKESAQSFSHTRPNGTSFWTVLKENGISYRGAGENIAWGQKTPEQVVDAWMNSEGHRANILNKNFTSIGVGYYLNGNTPYWSQLFTY